MAERVLAVRGPRSLLRQIREVMAGSDAAQAKLDQVVKIIARSMVAEVCSLYLRRASGEMELFATEGLKREAVHVTRLGPNEGLVGEIVRLGRPLNLTNAPEHPNFSYREETGEDPFHAFLGVPLLRGGRPIGALVVQNRTARVYAEDEVEDLQTIAMVLVELIGQGDLAGLDASKGRYHKPRPKRLKGRMLADGTARGTVLLHEEPVSELLLADDPEREGERLEAAIAALHSWIGEIQEGQRATTVASFEVFETYRLSAQDPDWNRYLQEGVASGLTAEAAIYRSLSEIRARMAHSGVRHERERLLIRESLANRLLRELGRNDREAKKWPRNAVLVAESLGLLDLLEYHGKGLAGVVLNNELSIDPSTAINILDGIPFIVKVNNIITEANNYDNIIIDGPLSQVILRPEPIIESSIDVHRSKNIRQERRPGDSTAHLVAERIEMVATELDRLRINSISEHIDELKVLSGELKRFEGDISSRERGVTNNTLKIFSNIFDHVEDSKSIRVIIAGAVAGILGPMGWPAITVYMLTLAAWEGKEAFIQAIKKVPKNTKR